MKKTTFILSILVALFSSYSLLSASESKEFFSTRPVGQEKMQRINSVIRTDVEANKGEITIFNTIPRLLVTSVVNLEDQKKGKEDNNTIGIVSLVIGLVGLFIGLVSLIMARSTKQLLSSIEMDKRIEQIIISPHIINSLYSYLFNNRQQKSSESTTTQQLPIKKEIDNYLYSIEFKSNLREMIITELNSKPVQSSFSAATPSGNPPYYTKTTATTQLSPSHHTNTAKPLYELYAKESNSMQLTSVQNSYQKGKSIYKLTLADSYSDIAHVTLCLEQEDAKERILSYGDKYLEPICDVSRLSNQPTTIEVKSTGTARKIGNEWRVIKQVKVEIK